MAGQLASARRRTTRSGPSVLALVALAVLVASVARRDPLAAVALALLPTVALLITRPAALAVLGLAALPVTSDVAPGIGLRITVSDLALALAVLAVLAAGRTTAWSSLRPALPWVGAYAVALVPSLVAHHESVSLVSSFQRLQIVVVPLVVGALVLRDDGLSRALTAYIWGSTVVVVLFGLQVLPVSLELQKNPVGQFAASAVLVVVADPSRRLRLAALPPLLYGLFQTESRGAVLGLVGGFAVLVLARPGAARLRTAALLAPVLVLGGLAFLALPQEARDRTTTFVVDDEQPRAPSGGEYTIRIREAYREDALGLVQANPVTGVGIGQYLSGNVVDGTLVADPHQVLLFEAAEGGLPLLLGFGVLLGGTAVLLWRVRSVTPLAGLALAVQTAIVGHAMVDVYWVRGTPVLGWLLVGAALADAGRRQRA